jgi:hypothetical protein
LVLIAGGVVAAAGTAETDEAPVYRLAGIIELGQRNLALLELPDDSQVTVEAGDVVGDARVTAVERRTLTLELSTGRVVLALSGDPLPTLAAAPAPPQVISRRVSVAALRRLAALRDAPGDSEQEIAAAINETLGLPTATTAAPSGSGFARLAAVPARELIERLYNGLAGGQPVKLYLDGSSADEIYLLPEFPGS